MTQTTMAMLVKEDNSSERFNEVYKALPAGAECVWIDANNNAMHGRIKEVYWDDNGRIRVSVEYTTNGRIWCASPTYDRVGRLGQRDSTVPAE